MNDNNIKEQIAGIFTRAAPTYDQVGFRIFYHFGKRLVELTEIPKKLMFLTWLQVEELYFFQH